MPTAKRTQQTEPRKRGRPALGEEGKTVPFVVRLTEEQSAKLRRLGGAAWVRDRVNKAREPGPQQE